MLTEALYKLDKRFLLYFYLSTTPSILWQASHQILFADSH